MAASNADSEMEVDPGNVDFNILLLGETGVGKSTFINSFVNFLQHTTFNNARMSQLACLIPLKFAMPNENYEEQVVQFGFDKNEDTILGNSSTQETKAYVFPFEKHNIRLIDTPGIGDARGIKQDEVNFQNVLDHIAQYDQLHAICFLLKPNVTVLNAYFKFSIMHLISRLDKSAVDNIVFIFTNSRNTFYRPGETLPLLKRILKEIKDTPPYIEVPLSKDNMFCIDNEAFKFLIAMRAGLRFEGTEIAEFRKSWRTSYKTCKDLMYYICGGEDKESITPHNVESTISVNRARKAILNLMKPIADTVEYILDTITILRKKIDELKQDKLSKSELTKLLNVPKIEHKIKTLHHPITVCTSPKCSDFDGKLQKYKHNTICHTPCYLTNISVGIIGSSLLLDCAAFLANGYCTHCRCDVSKHMHIYYETETIVSVQENQAVKAMINNKMDAINAAKNLTRDLNNDIYKYREEMKSINTCMAKFFHFLKNNSISSGNDEYLEYLNHIIERETQLDSFQKNQRIRYYNELKQHYEGEKKKLIDSNETITAEEIPNLVAFLYELEHTGPQISVLHSVQRDCVVKSLHNQEYKYPTLMKAFVDAGDSSGEDENDECNYKDDEMDASTVFCPNIIKMPCRESLSAEGNEETVTMDATLSSLNQNLNPNDVYNIDVADDVSSMECQESSDQVTKGKSTEDLKDVKVTKSSYYVEDEINKEMSCNNSPSSSVQTQTENGQSSEYSLETMSSYTAFKNPSDHNEKYNDVKKQYSHGAHEDEKRYSNPLPSPAEASLSSSRPTYSQALPKNIDDSFKSTPTSQLPSRHESNATYYKDNRPNSQLSSRNESNATYYRDNRPNSQSSSRNESNATYYSDNMPNSQSSSRNESNATDYSDNRPNSQSFSRNDSNTAYYSDNKPNSRSSSSHSTHKIRECAAITFKGIEPSSQSVDQNVKSTSKLSYHSSPKEKDTGYNKNKKPTTQSSNQGRGRNNTENASPPGKSQDANTKKNKSSWQKYNPLVFFYN